MGPRGTRCYLAGLFYWFNALAPSAVSTFSYRFIVFVWTGENDLITLHMDANFFEKKVAFSNNELFVLFVNGFLKKKMRIIYSYL